MLMILEPLRSCEQIICTKNYGELILLVRGMKTIYIRRVTEDPDEDMAKVKSDVDLFIADADERRGLSKLADLWGA